MSGHMKTHHTNPSHGYLTVTLNISGFKATSFKVPDTPIIKRKLGEFKKLCQEWAKLVTPWEESIPWEKVAVDNIARYTKAGIALRGARYREGISQKKLSKLCGISQDNLSRMENGKRAIGEKTAKKLAKVLHINHRLLMLK
jgi:DNA-binding XRE family transcriptional regulator